MAIFGNVLGPNSSQFLHLNVSRPEVSELGICTASGLSELLLGIVGSDTKAMGVVCVPREVQCPGNSFAAAVDTGQAETV